MMKTNRYARILSLGTLLLGVTTPLHVAGGETPDASGATLQMAVQLPPSWAASPDGDYAADLFSDRVYAEFRRLGYQGNIEQVDRFDEKQPGSYRLELRLTEWRLNAAGNIDCSFTAALHLPEGEKSLGVYTGSALHSVLGGGPISVGDSFGKSADDAIRNLYRDLAKQEFVPGLRMES